MLYRALRFCLFCLLPLLSSTSQASDLLILGDDNYRPLIYLDPQHQPAGLLVDVIEHYAKVSGKAIRIRLYPWKRAYTSAENAQGGVIGLSRTEERLALFDYSDPIYDDTINVVVRKDHAFMFHDLSDLKGKKIGVQLGASYGSDVDSAIAAGDIQVEADQTHAARMRKVLHGRVDAAFLGNGRLGLETILDSDPELAQHKDELIILGQPLIRDPLYLGFAKSMQMQAFLADFNRVLAAARANQSVPGLSESPVLP